MIDIHTHIIPNIDDGSMNIEMSLEMLKQQISQNVDEVIFTPHTRFHRSYNSKDKIISAYNKLLEEINKKGLNGKYYLGAEIYFDKNTINQLKNDELLTLNGTDYVLIEFDFESKYDYISEALYSVQLLGYKPILAHVERYKLSYDEIKKIKKEGILLQWNTSYICQKKLGRKLFVNKLIKNGLIDYIASDCHSDNHRCPNLLKVSKILQSNNSINVNRFEK